MGISGAGGRIGSVSALRHKRRKAFFSEEKKQKTLVLLSSELNAASRQKSQEFFGSYFQKRTISLAVPAKVRVA
jgi:hypothetical protein